MLTGIFGGRGSQPPAQQTNTSGGTNGTAQPTATKPDDGAATAQQPKAQAAEPEAAPKAQASEAPSTAPRASDDTRRGSAAASLAELSARPEQASVALPSKNEADARAQAEASVAQARGAVAFDRVMSAAQAPEAAVQAPIAGPADETPALAREVETIRAIERPGAEPVLDRRR